MTYRRIFATISRGARRAVVIFAIGLCATFSHSSLPAQPKPPQAIVAPSRKSYDEARVKMVQDDVIGNGVTHPRVIESMRLTPRHEFVPLNIRHKAYMDMALAIGEGQTISSPYIVAFMTEQLDPQPGDKVLEIGTGSGYQAAVLSSIVKEVYTIEIVEALGRKAAQTLKQTRYKNVEVKVGDGFKGWPEHAPFDKIIVTCSPEKVPEPLVEQLREGGQMVIPVGERYQQTMVRFTKKKGKLAAEALQPTFFVPMTGTAEQRREVQPDPANPHVANGGFEQIDKTTKLPVAWYYSHQMSVVVGKDAPQGKTYVEFENAESGRQSQALQGFAVDGRKVQQLEVSCRVKADRVRMGESRDQLPIVGITYFDQRRAPVGESIIGPWFGSFDWQRELSTVKVPIHAREASIRIGLFGATGKVGFDEIEVKKVK